VAIITAVFMVAIVGLCLAVMARSYIAQARLTAETVAHRQLSLLMDAGIQIVQSEEARKAAPGSVQNIALPEPLLRQGGRLTIRSETSGADVQVYQITSRFRRWSRTVLAAYDRITGRWILR
jgi:hypothetical protein